MKFLNNFSEKPVFRNYFFYALVIKGLMFILYAFLMHKSTKGNNVNYVFNYSRDYHSYIDPAVNLVETGEYYEEYNGKKLYAHKMPGMTPIFAVLYYLLGLKGGLTVLVILQYAIDALCCVLLGCIARKLFNTNSAFYIAFFLYAFSSVVSVGSHHAVSELFCTSFSIIAVYCFLHASAARHYLLAGFFATWSVFFRPTSILLFLFLPLVLVILTHNKFSFQSIKSNFYKISLFFIPFLLVESIWIARNDATSNKFIPADNVIENFGNPASKAVFSVILDLGGDLQSWNEDSEMRWFANPLSENYDAAYAASFPFPAYVTASGISEAELRLLRDDYCKYDDPSTPSPEKEVLEKEILAISTGISKHFKSRAPFYYYVVAPLRTLKTLVFIKRPYGFSLSGNGLPEKGLRLWHFISYYIPLLLFLMSFLWIFKGKGNYPILIIALMAASHMILYGFILRYSENRYLVPVHPFFILVSCGTVLYLASRFFKRSYQEPLVSE